MRTDLLHEIEAFLAETGMSPGRFGYNAIHNSRLVERLKNGGRIWPDTEQKIRDFMASHRKQRGKAA